MKLNCEVVQDLYILYQEGELSPSVKKAVEEHLEECAACREIYKEGTGFQDVIAEEESIEPPQKLDEKIKLRLKLRRLKVVILFLVAFMVMYSAFHYVSNRKSLAYESANTEQIINDLSWMVDGIKGNANRPGVLDKITAFNQNATRIRRYLNYFEKQEMKNHPYEMSLSFNLNSFVEVMNSRYQAGTWNERDEKAYNMMKQYFEDYMRVLTDERLKLNHLDETFNLKAKFNSYDIGEMMTLNQKIDQLSYTYPRFNKFPDEIDVLTIDEAKQRLTELFDVDKEAIEFTIKLPKEIVKANGKYTFQISEKDKGYYGEIDAYTGMVISYDANNETTTGDLLPKEKSTTALQSRLGEIFGKQLDFEITDLGINYHYSSNVDHQFYTYDVRPKKNGYVVEDTHYRFFVDARTAKVVSMNFLNGTSYSPLRTFTMVDKKVSPEEGKALIEKDATADVTYLDTVYIASKLTGKYELVNRYRIGKHLERYINVQTGIEDYEY